MQIDVLGELPTESEAKAAIENFIEGTIEVEKPRYQGLQLFFSKEIRILLEG